MDEWMNVIECPSWCSRSQSTLQEAQKITGSPSHWLFFFLLFRGCEVAWHPPKGCLGVALQTHSPHSQVPRLSGWVAGEGWGGWMREAQFQPGDYLNRHSSCVNKPVATFQSLLVPGLVWLRIWKGGGMWLIHNNNHSPSPQPHASLSSSFEQGNGLKELTELAGGHSYWTARPGFKRLSALTSLKKFICQVAKLVFFKNL